MCLNSQEAGEEEDLVPLMVAITKIKCNLVVIIHQMVALHRRDQLTMGQAPQDILKVIVLLTILFNHPRIQDCLLEEGRGYYIVWHKKEMPTDMVVVQVVLEEV